VARLADRHPDNVEGEWYVDTRCIDCDASRHHAPSLIVARPDGQSVVARQPESADEEMEMWRAALACPTRSIGTEWLFSGDTLGWFHREGDLGAFRGATWYSWDALKDSLARFVPSAYRFSWILPGHGKWHGASASEMHEHLAALVERM
jgi:ferredoxin